MPPRPLILALLAAACAAPRAASLDNAAARADLSAQMVETLDRQQHYFADDDRRRAFGERMSEIAREASDARSFYEAASLALAGLGEGHTALVGSPEVPFTATIPPVALLEVEGAVVVAGVAPGVEGGGLREGDLLLAVDGAPVDETLARRFGETPGSTPHGRRARAVANLLAGPTATPARVAVRGADGRERECFPLRFLLDDEGEDRFRFGFLPATLTAMRVSAAAGYLHLPDFHPDRIEELETALEAFRELPTLVLDLRGNPGGRIQTLQRIAGLFLGDAADLVSLVQQRRTEMLRSAPCERPYRGKLRVLIDERTGSAAELLAAALQDLGRALLVGRPTAGSTRSRLSSVLPGGVTFHYAGASEFRRGDGRPIEGTGVRPDLIVIPTREGLARGEHGDPYRDPAVRTALDRN